MKYIKTNTKIDTMTAYVAESGQVIYKTDFPGFTTYEMDTETGETISFESLKEAKNYCEVISNKPYDEDFEENLKYLLEDIEDLKARMTEFEKSVKYIRTFEDFSNIASKKEMQYISRMTECVFHRVVGLTN